MENNEIIDDYKVVMHQYIGEEFGTSTYNITFNKPIDDINKLEYGLNHIPTDNIIENKDAEVIDESDKTNMLRITLLINIICGLLSMVLGFNGSSIGTVLLPVFVLLYFNLYTIFDK